MWRYLFPVVRLGTCSVDGAETGVPVDVKATAASASNAEIAELVRNLQFTAGRHACRASHECLGWPWMPKAGTTTGGGGGSGPSGGAAAKKRKVEFIAGGSSATPLGVDVRSDEERRREDSKARGLLDQYGSPAELMKRYYDTPDTGIDEHEVLALASAYRLGGHRAGAKALLALIEDPARESSPVKTNAARFASYGEFYSRILVILYLLRLAGRQTMPATPPCHPVSLEAHP